MRDESGQPEVEELWRRVGLESLRKTLTDIQALMGRFEQSLRALAPCEECTRAAMLEEMEHTGSRLGRGVIGLATLAGSLKDAVAAVEQSQEKLRAQPRGPCRCHP